MATAVHQCPRCELRFPNVAELGDHFSLDHAADPATFERFRYAGRSASARGGAGARQVLVVANQTLGGQHLLEAVQQRAAAGSARFFVLVPATHSAHHAEPRGGTEHVADEVAGADDVGVALARWRLRTTVDALHDAGVEAEGALGDPDPFAAVSKAFQSHRFDEIILSTLPSGMSRWLSVDLPGRLERRFGVPVTVLSGSGAD